MTMPHMTQPESAMDSFTKRVSNDMVQEAILLLDDYIIDSWEQQKTLFFKGSGNHEDDFADQDFVFHLLTVHAEKCVASSCSTGLLTTQRKTEPNPPTNFSNGETNLSECSDQSSGQDSVICRAGFSEVIDPVEGTSQSETPNKNTGSVTIKAEMYDENEEPLEEYNVQQSDDSGQNKDGGREEIRWMTSDSPAGIKVEEEEWDEVTPSSYNVPNSVTKENETLRLRMAQVQRLSSKCTVCHKIIQGERCQSILESEHQEGLMKCASCMQDNSFPSTENKLSLRNSSCERDLDRHKPFRCKSCPKAYNYRCLLDRHMRSHGDERPYKCHLCSKTFKEKSYLKTHLHKHTGERPYICDTCSMTFASKRNCIRHMKIHTGERPFECDICLKTYQRRSYLAFHKRTHTGERPFKCPVCLKAFKNKSHFTAHMRIHAVDRPYNCETCGKSFAVKSDCIRHMRNHTEARPFQCGVCLKAFKSKSHLANHMTVHTTERPFKCDLCPKTFTQRSNVKTHMASHTDDKAFNCILCPKAYKTKSNLRTHIKKAHT